MKQAKPSLEAARHVVACGLDLYAGDDDVIFPFLEVGGVGGICVHTHVVGPQVKEMVTRYNAGDVEGARAIDEELRPAIEILKVQTNPIAIKRALQLLGHEVGGLRLPLVEADEAETAADPRLPRASRAADARRGLMRESTRNLLQALIGAQAGGGFLAAPPGIDGSAGLGIAGVTGAPRPRGPWDAIASASAHELPGDTVTFVALEDGTLVVDQDIPDGSATPLADAVETQLARPYERCRRLGPRTTVWTVAAQSVFVTAAAPGDGARAELTRFGTVHATVDEPGRLRRLRPSNSSTSSTRGGGRSDHCRAPRRDHLGCGAVGAVSTTPRMRRGRAPSIDSVRARRSGSSRSAGSARSGRT